MVFAAFVPITAGIKLYRNLTGFPRNFFLYVFMLTIEILNFYTYILLVCYIFVNSYNESRNQIQRYIRLTNLVPELLQMADEGKIAFRPAVEISYLSQKQQTDLLETMSAADCTPSLAQAIKFKNLSRDNKQDKYTMTQMLAQPKANQREKIVFKRTIF